MSGDFRQQPFRLLKRIGALRTLIVESPLKSVRGFILKRAGNKALRFEEEGQKLRDTNPQEALRLFNKALALKPDRVPLLRVTARLLVKTGDYADAEPLWKRIKQTAGPELEASLQLARIYSKQRRYAECFEETQEVLKLSPDHAEGLRLESRSHARANPATADELRQTWSPDMGNFEATDPPYPPSLDVAPPNPAQISSPATVSDAAAFAANLPFSAQKPSVKLADPLRTELQALRSALINGEQVNSMSVPTQRAIITLLKKIAREGLSKRYSKELVELDRELRAAPQEGPLSCWLLATIASSQDKRIDALRHLDECLRYSRQLAELGVDIHVERALFFAKYNQFGEALVSREQASATESDAYFLKRMGFIDQVMASCENPKQPARYPECLIDLIVRYGSEFRSSLATKAERNHVCMVSSSLGPGGSERQLTTMCKGLALVDTIKLSLLVRSVHLEPEDDFFLDEVRHLPLNLRIYGEQWYRQSSAAAALPEFSAWPALYRAIDLLPPTLREDVIRLTRIFLDRRPAIVHIWQDLPGAGLAACLAGVPKYFIRRGSLSPNHWQHSDLRLETQVRPLRHLYRQLLQHSDFSILNNSQKGSASDIDWVAAGDPERQFAVIPNALDFAGLGSAIEKNEQLRRTLSIDPAAPVIGSVFRFVPVKRPVMWFKIARLVAAALPNAHFIIVGDGPLLPAFRQAIADAGLSGRFHLPGKLQNVGDWYRAMDVLLLTSSREGFPNVILESQYFGVPVVAPDVGGIPEVVMRDVTGFIVGDDSAEAYADTILDLLRDPDRLVRARRNGRKYVQDQFGLENITGQVLKYYGLVRCSEQNF